MASLHLPLIFFVLISNIRRLSTLQICNIDQDCPKGEICSLDGSVKGISVCLQNDGMFRRTNASGTRQVGRCPISSYDDLFSANSSQVDISRRCNSHDNCQPNEVCCAVLDGKISVCLEQEIISDAPQVTVIIEGHAKEMSDSEYSFLGSVTLIQSKGVDILVDSGNVRNKIEIMEFLYKNAGLSPEDIDFVITSHGHPDHFSNNDLFPVALNIFSTYVVNDTRFSSHPSNTNQTRLINNDSNLELIPTPGHSAECVSLIVHNVQNSLTVSVVGDLFLYKGDSKNEDLLRRVSHNFTALQENRRKIACQSDFIVPGHGPPFKVDEKMKKEFKC